MTKGPIEMHASAIDARAAREMPRRLSAHTVHVSAALTAHRCSSLSGGCDVHRASAKVT